MRGIEQTVELLPGLDRAGAVRVLTGDDGGSIVREVLARSVLTKTAADPITGDRWAAEPIHVCTADCGHDRGAADSRKQVIVALNAAAVLRAELRRTRGGRTVELGAVTDPYVPIEARYRLMPGVIRALADARAPLRLRTAGAVIAPDVALLRDAAAAAPVTITVPVPTLDTAMAAMLDPGGPAPSVRLGAIAELAAAGLAPHVEITPVLPYLGDDPPQLAELFAALVGAGAATATVAPLHLPGGAADPFYTWLSAEHPGLVRHYRRLYGTETIASPGYRRRLAGVVDRLRTEHGLPRPAPGPAGPAGPRGHTLQARRRSAHAGRAVQDALF